jgi:hypothetical protein
MRRGRGEEEKDEDEEKNLVGCAEVDDVLVVWQFEKIIGLAYSDSYEIRS